MSDLADNNIYCHLDQYPHIVVRYVPGFYGRHALRAGISREEAIAAGWKMMAKFHDRLWCCVVFGPEDARYLYPGGKWADSDTPPSGGAGEVLAGMLKQQDR